MTLYNRIDWLHKSDQEKAESVCRALSLPTHNGYSKADLIMMLDWCFHKMYECDNPCLVHRERYECLGMPTPEPYEAGDQE